MLQVADAPVPASIQVTPLTVNVPVGVLLVPVSVSVTVTVHAKAIPTIPLAGQETFVLVVRGLTVTVKALLGPLPVWDASPAKVTVTKRLPGLGVEASVAMHDAVAPVPVSVHCAVGAKVSVPVGVTAVPAVEESVTVPVHVVVWPTSMDDGEHATLTAVVRGLTVTLAGFAVLSLPPCEESPL